MSNYFKDKVFIVTGASSGLGFEISKKLAKQGAYTVLFSRKLEALTDTIERIGDVSHAPLLIAGDVSREADVNDCIKKTIFQYGKIHGMILNAGKSMWKRFLDLESPREMEEIMEVNYWGVVNFCYYGIPLIRESQGKIVIISSLQSIIGTPYHTGYAASKHALNGFVDSLRLEEDVSLLNVIVSWIRGTSLRQNSLMSEKVTTHNSTLPSTKRSNDFFSISVEDCAKEIIETLPLNKKTLYLPAIIGLFPMVKLFLSDWLSKKIKRAVNKEISKKLHS